MPTRVLPLLSPLLSVHQAFYTHSLGSFLEYDEGKYSLTTDCGPVMLLPSFVSKWSVVSDKDYADLWRTVLSGPPLLGGHLTLPRGLPLNRGSIVIHWENSYENIHLEFGKKLSWQKFYRACLCSFTTHYVHCKKEKRNECNIDIDK